MTLRDKLLQCPDQQGWTNPNYGRAENLEKISDEYAIEFAYFIDKYKTYHRVHKSNEQLLEIFKKEKGL